MTYQISKKTINQLNLQPDTKPRFVRVSIANEDVWEGEDGKYYKISDILELILDKLNVIK